ncbi:TetR/AcrR family transcriptional regulator [Streptomyces sp. NPDC093094]|uniref:TetR/AcrR family transcriptional regulator n=1 Tax=Streptomyces sp. NPDC093094 TaxID=3366026 RepID=UPI0037FB8BAE
MSSATPAQNRPDAPVSLTERRKAETRMDIARAAAGLFVARGLKATRAEDIAQAAGIAPRTFYRYFASKEEAVAPLYSAGARRWVQAVREAPAGLDAPAALEHAVRQTLVPGGGVSAAHWEWVRPLLRLAGSSPALGKVWAEVCRTAEEELGPALAERGPAVSGDGASGDGAPGDGASGDGASGDGASGDGASGDGGALGEAAGDNVAPDPARRRFVAAVASAAVRVAVEAWAAGDAPPAGAQGPAALALRNLEALRGFEWG